MQAIIFTEALTRKMQMLPRSARAHVLANRKGINVLQTAPSRGTGQGNGAPASTSTARKCPQLLGPFQLAQQAHKTLPLPRHAVAFAACFYNSDEYVSTVVAPAILQRGR